MPPYSTLESGYKGYGYKGLSSYNGFWGDSLPRLHRPKKSLNKGLFGYNGGKGASLTLPLYPDSSVLRFQLLPHNSKSIDYMFIKSFNRFGFE